MYKKHSRVHRLREQHWHDSDAGAIEARRRWLRKRKPKKQRLSERDVSRAPRLVKKS